VNFRPVLADRVLAGRKTVTRRLISDNPRSPYHPDRAVELVGKRVAICPGRGKHRIGTAVVAKVERETFDPMHAHSSEVEAEGFVSLSELLGVWATIHRDLSPVEVWRIEFALPRYA
jgi:uncharacterized protein YhfF